MLNLLKYDQRTDKNDYGVELYSIMFYARDEPTQAPIVSAKVILNSLSRSYGVKNARLTQLTGYEDCNFRVTDIEWNFECVDNQTEAILKVTNPIEARLSHHLDVQIEFCRLLRENGVPAPTVIPTLDGKPIAWIEISPGVSLPIRLFQILPGTKLEDFKLTRDLVSLIGASLAKLHAVADEYKISTDHVPYISPVNVASLLEELKIIEEAKTVSQEQVQLARGCLENIYQVFESAKDVGLIHSDFNETNILIESLPGDKVKVAGVLDFGDMHTAPRCFDIGAAVLYLMLFDQKQTSCFALISMLLEGYRSKREFKEDYLILDSLRGRLAASLVYGLRTARLNVRGESIDYVLKTQINGWTTLEELNDT